MGIPTIILCLLHIINVFPKKGKNNVYPSLWGHKDNPKYDPTKVQCGEPVNLFWLLIKHWVRGYWKECGWPNVEAVVILDASTREAKAGGSGVQGKLWLWSTLRPAWATWTSLIRWNLPKQSYTKEYRYLLKQIFSWEALLGIIVKYWTFVPSSTALTRSKSAKAPGLHSFHLSARSVLLEPTSRAIERIIIKPIHLKGLERPCICHHFNKYCQIEKTRICFTLSVFHYRGQ